MFHYLMTGLQIYNQLCFSGFQRFGIFRILSLWRGLVLMVHCGCYLFAQDSDLMTFGILHSAAQLNIPAKQTAVKYSNPDTVCLSCLHQFRGGAHLGVDAFGNGSLSAHICVSVTMQRKTAFRWLMLCKFWTLPHKEVQQQQGLSHQSLNVSPIRGRILRPSAP